MIASYALGLGLGLLGGALHLALTAWRARLVCSGRLQVSLWLLPAALAGPALAVLGASAVAPEAAWSAIPGILVVRHAALSRWRQPDAT